MNRHVQISPEETIILQNLASDVPDGGVIVEIGSAWGWSATNMALASKQSVKIFCIDPWTLSSEAFQEKREKKFDRSIMAFGQRIVKIKAFSQDVKWKDEIDLLFIDGNHQHPFVDMDYDNFSPFVKDKGVIVFHDYVNIKCPAVREVVERKVEPSLLWKWVVQESMWMGKKCNSS